METVRKENLILTTENKNIIILGGGSAGWMTAATLIKCFPDKKITVIESPNIPIVGVGESTLQFIRGWSSLLEVDDKEFLSKCNGTYKLSIKFNDFYKKGESFHYPFGDPVTGWLHVGVNDWWMKQMVDPQPQSDYAETLYPSMGMVRANTLSYNKPETIQDFKFHKHTAFHFDATQFGLWLKDNFCIPRGVKNIKEEITDIEHDETGIKSLNKKYTADLFIDCTGFKSLLLSETLKEPFTSFSDLLPNDSAWAVHLPYKDKKKEIFNYTDCTAIENGWVWRIPLWSRIGSGYVYSSKFVNKEKALEEFKIHLNKKGYKPEELTFKHIDMRVGIHERLWVKNVCAIGLSAGFIEPLESNGLYTVHEFLLELVRALHREKTSQFDKDNFNHTCTQMFYNFADFVALHYALSQRTDTPYWKSLFEKEWINNLLKRNGTLTNGIEKVVSIKNFEYKFSLDNGIHIIAAGMNWAPTNLETIVARQIDNNFMSWKMQFERSAKILKNQKDRWYKYAEENDSTYEFLKKNIYTTSQV